MTKYCDPLRAAASHVLTLCLLIGCGSDGAHRQRSSGSSPRATRQALTGGAPDESAPGTGLIRVYGGGAECSGQMLTRQWVITAAHCFCPSEASSDATVSSSSVRVALGTESAKATIVQFHPTLDLALLRIERMLPLGAQVKLWTASSSALVDGKVECRGFDRTAADGGAPASAQVRVTSSGNALGNLPSSCSGGGTGGQVDGFAVALAGGDGDAGPAFEAFDAGAPCFVDDAGDRYLAGIVAGASSTDPLSGWVVGVDGVQSWIRATTDIWSAADCSSDVPGTKFAVDPMIFVGAPNGSTLSLVSQHAYGVPGDPKVIVLQTTGTRFTSWTTLASPPNVDDMLAIGASVDPGATDQQGALMRIQYMDGQHVQRSGLWYDPSSKTWVGLAYQPYAGVGIAISQVRPRVGIDYSVTLPMWISDQGVAGTTMYVGTTYSTKQAINAFVDMPMPRDAPAADATRRPSVIYNPFTVNVLGGYRSFFGQFVGYRASGACAANNDSLSPWCGPTAAPTLDAQTAPAVLGQVTAFDLPMADVRDVGLGVTTVPSETYWAVSVGHDNQMRLWLLAADGHASDYGPLGDQALGMVKTVPYEPVPGHQVLLASYAGESWSARVRPVGNCLGNTPPGW